MRPVARVFSCPRYVKVCVVSDAETFPILGMFRCALDLNCRRVGERLCIFCSRFFVILLESDWAKMWRR